MDKIGYIIIFLSPESTYPESSGLLIHVDRPSTIPTLSISKLFLSLRIGMPGHRGSGSKRRGTFITQNGHTITLSQGDDLKDSSRQVKVRL